MEKEAVKLARNPLGIIALFILLIYSFASLLFGLGGAELSNAQKWWFVKFLVTFPYFVLVVFTYLVVRHHEKLYGPGEYKDEKHFLGLNTPEETNKKNEEEISETENEQEKSETKSGNVKVLTREQHCKLFQEQRKKVNNIKRLVFNYYEKKFDYEITRDVNYLVNNNKIYFDGVSEKKGSLTFLETKYIQNGFIPRILLKDIRYNAIEVKNLLQQSALYHDYTFRLLFTFVVENEYENEINDLKQRLHSFIDTELIQIGIRVLTMKDLEDSE